MFMLIVQQTANTVYGPNKKTKGRATDFKIYLLGAARMDRNRSEQLRLSSLKTKLKRRS